MNSKKASEKTGRRSQRAAWRDHSHDWYHNHQKAEQTRKREFYSDNAVRINAARRAKYKADNVDSKKPVRCKTLEDKEVALDDRIADAEIKIYETEDKYQRQKLVAKKFMLEAKLNQIHNILENKRYGTPLYHCSKCISVFTSSRGVRAHEKSHREVNDTKY